MHVQNFNRNTPAHLHAVIASGQPQEVTRHNGEWVTVVPTALFHRLIAELGDRGPEILAEHRQRAADRLRAAEITAQAVGTAVA